MLRVLARLLKAGVSVERIKVALRSLRKFHKHISPSRLPAQYLVTDGRNVFLLEKDKLRHLDGSDQMSFLFVLQLKHVRADVLLAAARG